MTRGTLMVRALWSGAAIAEFDDTDGRRRSGEGPFDRLRKRRPAPAQRVETSAPASAMSDLTLVVDLDDHTFFGSIEGRPSIVDFWAPWCAPCKAFHPEFERSAAGHAGRAVQFARVNVDAAGGVATAFQVMSIPTVIVLDHLGREIDRQVGVPGRRRLDEMIRQAENIGAAADNRGLA